MSRAKLVLAPRPAKPRYTFAMLRRAVLMFRGSYAPKAERRALAALGFLVRQGLVR